LMTSASHCNGWFRCLSSSLMPSVVIEHISPPTTPVAYQVWRELLARLNRGPEIVRVRYGSMSNETKLIRCASLVAYASNRMHHCISLYAEADPPENPCDTVFTVRSSTWDIEEDRKNTPFASPNGLPALRSYWRIVPAGRLLASAEHFVRECLLVVSEVTRHGADEPLTTKGVVSDLVPQEIKLPALQGDSGALVPYVSAPFWAIVIGTLRTPGDAGLWAPLGTPEAPLSIIERLTTAAASMMKTALSEPANGSIEFDFGSCWSPVGG